MVFGGRLVSDGELEALLATAEHYIDTLSVDHNVNLVVPRGTPLHFGNHSCDPTLWWAGDLSLAARRALKAGEEATLDYGTITDSRATRCVAAADLASAVGGGDGSGLETARPPKPLWRPLGARPS